MLAIPGFAPLFFRFQYSYLLKYDNAGCSLFIGISFQISHNYKMFNQCDLIHIIHIQNVNRYIMWHLAINGRKLSSKLKEQFHVKIK